MPKGVDRDGTISAEKLTVIFAREDPEHVSKPQGGHGGCAVFKSELGLQCLSPAPLPDGRGSAAPARKLGAGAHHSSEVVGHTLPTRSTSDTGSWEL